MNESDCNEKLCFDSAKILYNYPPKGEKNSGGYIPRRFVSLCASPLFTVSGNSCILFSFFDTSKN